METLNPSPRSRPLRAVALALVIGFVLVATLAGWVSHGTSILFTYAQDGLAWCF